MAPAIPHISPTTHKEPRKEKLHLYWISIFRRGGMGDKKNLETEARQIMLYKLVCDIHYLLLGPSK
jgi:hypothetical protein